jgi:predicted O-methyltransferase YrrM
MIFHRRKAPVTAVTPPVGPPSPLQEWPPGHFYSPIPSESEVATGLARKSESYGGLNLNEAVQVSFLEDIRRIYARLRFPGEREAGRRYFYANGSFGALDAICLAAMAARFTPKRIVEVGSGYSSAAILDLCDDGLIGPAELVFIDPDFSKLHELLSAGDKGRVTLLQQRVQDVDLKTFSRLEAGDILFIDSSHVSKIGSDVNFLVFEVLPILQPGVVVHIHDVFDGFEYPRQWLEAGRYWNEQYLIRAFLMYNSAYEILFMSSFVFNRHNEFFRTQAPLSLKSGGGQLWLQRKA